MLTPAQIAALKTEITVTDPAQGVPLGLLAPWGAGNFGAVLALLNAQTVTATKMDRRGIPAQEIIQAIALSEYAALTAVQRDYLSLLLSSGEAVTIAGQVKANLGAIFTVGAAPTTRAAILALIDRPSSRAEVLWGYGTVVTLEDLAAARSI